MTEQVRVSFQTFNPYECRYPGRRVVPREALLFAKRLRREGFLVNVASSGEDRADYIGRKGFGALLQDPVIVTFSGCVASVALNLVSSWIYDLLKRDPNPIPHVPEELSLVVEVDEAGNRVRYDHKGREISDRRFEQILGLMKERQAGYARSLSHRSPDPKLPVPIYLEHTDRIVGWANVELDDASRALVVRPARIDDDETWQRIETGELQGFSIAGLVAGCTCEVCGSDFRDCPHGADHDDEAVNRITRFDLCEISLVREPVNHGTRIQLSPGVSNPRLQRPARSRRR